MGTVGIQSRSHSDTPPRRSACPHLPSASGRLPTSPTIVAISVEPVSPQGRDLCSAPPTAAKPHSAAVGSRPPSHAQNAKARYQSTQLIGSWSWSTAGPPFASGSTFRAIGPVTGLLLSSGQVSDLSFQSGLVWWKKTVPGVIPPAVGDQWVCSAPLGGSVVWISFDKAAESANGDLVNVKLEGRYGRRIVVVIPAVIGPAGDEARETATVASAAGGCQTITRGSAGRAVVAVIGVADTTDIFTCRTTPIPGAVLTYTAVAAATPTRTIADRPPGATGASARSAVGPRVRNIDFRPIDGIAGRIESDQVVGVDLRGSAIAIDAGLVVSTPAASTDVLKDQPEHQLLVLHVACSGAHLGYQFLALTCGHRDLEYALGILIARDERDREWPFQRPVDIRKRKTIRFSVAVAIPGCTADLGLPG